MRLITLLCGVNIFLCRGAYSGAHSCTPACQNGGNCVAANDCECTYNYAGPACGTSLVDPGWTDGGNGFQYMKTSAALKWFDAETECWKKGGHLAFQGARDPVAFASLATMFATTNTWIGLEGINFFVWRWIDNMKLTDTWSPWAATETGKDDEQRCTAINSGSKMGAAYPCSNAYFGLCEKSIGTPMRFREYNQGVKTYFRTPGKATFEMAEILCEQKKAHLVVLGATTAASLKTIVDAVMGSTTTTDAWIGYEDMGTFNIYKSIIGFFSIPAPNPARWATGEPDSGEDCAATNAGLNGKVKNLKCDEKHYGICEKAIMKSRANICPSGAVCTNGQCLVVLPAMMEMCECDNGFYDLTGSGTCTDVNECLGAAPCPSGQVCTNTPVGSFTCTPSP